MVYNVHILREVVLGGFVEVKWCVAERCTAGRRVVEWRVAE